MSTTAIYTVRIMGDPAADPMSSLTQYGVVGAVFGVVFATIVLPIVRAMIQQNAQSLDLLKRAVDTNTEAVASFRTLAAETENVTEALLRIETKIDSRYRNNP